MTDARAVQHHQIEQLRRDISAFADPGTIVELNDPTSRNITVTWNLRGKRRVDNFSISPTDGIKHIRDGERYDYRIFLASEDLSDLYGLARMIKQASPRSLFVPTKAIKDDGNDGEKVDAIEVIKGVIGAEPVSGNGGTYTALLMVKGQAGAGKTEVLRELVKRQATEYLRGSTGFIYLYVDAQGRALTRLNEAFAVELQDLRAKLTYHQIATLVREELIVPVIDGFDELIGVSGYEDAFGSLLAFLDELAGRGSVVASARNLFYEREFLSRASNAEDDAWVLRAVSVEPWGEHEQEKYVQLVAAERSFDPERTTRLKKSISEIFKGPNEALGQKPFFVAKTLSLIIDGYLSAGNFDLRQSLVEGFIKRETEEKLLDSDGRSILSAAQISTLLKELTEEMWNLGVRELDISSLNEVAAYIIELNELDDSAKRILLERISTMAFFRKGSRQGRIAFEHEMFLEFFLATVAIDKICTSNDQIKVFGSRGILENDACFEIERQLSAQTDANKMADVGIQNVCGVELIHGSSNVALKENLGRLLCSLFRVMSKLAGKASEYSFRDFVFRNCSFSEIVLVKCNATNCQFIDVEFTKSKFEECNFLNCYFFKPKVSRKSTRWHVDGIKLGAGIQGIIDTSSGIDQEFFKESDVAEILNELGVSGIDLDAEGDQLKVDDPLEELVYRLVTAYRRANPVCKGDHNLSTLFDDDNWKLVESALTERGLVTEEFRRTSGKKIGFLRRHFLPDQLLAARSKSANVPDKLKLFWKDLAAHSVS